jgi:hypothetical protein
LDLGILGVKIKYYDPEECYTSVPFFRLEIQMAANINTVAFWLIT